MSNSLKISREWAMPNKNTFQILPIKKLIHRYYKKDMVSVDPFANNNRLASITNDLDPQYNTDYHLDALEFLKRIESNSADLVFYDPPYSNRQIVEVYKKMKKSVNMETTQGIFWRRLKVEIARITKPGGIVLSFGWNSGGIGKKLGFKKIEILLVAHGGIHNDTIVTVERKIQGSLI